MNTAQMYRVSGLVVLLGIALSVVSTVVSGVAFPDTSNPAAATNPAYLLLSLLGVVGTVLVLFGLPAIYARSAREGGLVWLIGIVLIAFTGMLFGLFFGLLGILVFPVLATQAPDLFREGPPPSFFAVFIVGTLANVLGALLMAIPMLTKRIYPRWCGYLMIVEAVLAVASFAVNGPSSSSSPLLQLLNIVSPLPLFAVLGWVGYELWSGRAPAGEVVSGSTAAQPV